MLLRDEPLSVDVRIEEAEDIKSRFRKVRLPLRTTRLLLKADVAYCIVDHRRGPRRIHYNRTPSSSKFLGGAKDDDERREELELVPEVSERHCRGQSIAIGTVPDADLTLIRT